MKNILLLITIALLIAAGALIWFVFLRPNSVISRADAKSLYSLPESHFLEWRGGEVHYVDEGAGKTVLMIHGLAGSHRNFGLLSERLKSDYRCVRVDLPGFGLSDLPEAPDKDYRMLYSDFFEFFFEALQLDTFYVMGNSMGGWMAWEIAAAHPEKVDKLFLFCSAGYDMENVAKKLSMGMSASSGIVEKLMRRGVPYSATRRNVEKCFADVSRIKKEEVDVANALTNREGNFRTILELLRYRKDADTSLIKTIQSPTLIIAGKKDNIIPYEHAYRFQRDIPDSKLIIYENCGHIPMVEKTEDVERDFREFVSNSGE